MIESEPIPASTARAQEEQMHENDAGSAGGALTLTGIATAIVVAIWLAFYFLIFVPRAPTP